MNPELSYLSGHSSQLVAETLHLCLLGAGVIGSLPCPHGIYMGAVCSNSGCHTYTENILFSEPLPSVSVTFVCFLVSLGAHVKVMAHLRHSVETVENSGDF